MRERESGSHRMLDSSRRLHMCNGPSMYSGLKVVQPKSYNLPIPDREFGPWQP